ncbi:unnamed protein product [Heligmosomoides polygyrus]|uniref:DUF5641 domain-containing protein n=1 Tax=Heligmosomoides polygyrus TaxID=6339 RepID=A0A183FIX0_HELPZ|nr:unnamed protein product [Heligmosomoides polygyrus]
MLKKSCEIVNKFWDAWSSTHLTSLREQHKKLLQQGKSTPRKPQTGEVVLVRDPFQARNNWKIGRIIALGNSQDGETREVELMLPSRNIIKRPINVLIPLELPQDNVRQPRQEQAAESREHTTHTTHRNQQTPWEQSSRHSDGNARYNLRKKPAVPYCPYNEQEYEVNCITSQDSLHKCPCFSMNATEAAVQLIRSLCKESSFPLNEKELQRRLEIVYDDITTNTADIETMKSRIRALELQNQADSDSPKLVYDAITEVISALQVTKQKMEADYHLGNILWEIYRLMIEAGVATDSGKESFEEKPRKAERINDLITNNTILLKEIEHAEELISRATAIKRNSYIDFPDEKSIAESLNRIENMLRSPRPTLDYVVTVDQRLQNLEDRISKIEELLQSLGKAQEEKAEILLNAQINAMVQITKAVQEKQEQKTEDLVTITTTTKTRNSFLQNHSK